MGGGGKSSTESTSTTNNVDDRDAASASGGSTAVGEIGGDFSIALVDNGVVDRAFSFAENVAQGAGNQVTGLVDNVTQQTDKTLAKLSELARPDSESFNNLTQTALVVGGVVAAVVVFGRAK